MKVTVTVAEQVFRTYEMEVEVDENDPDRQTFEEAFEEDDGDCIQDSVNDRDFSLDCQRCKAEFSPCEDDQLTAYCDDCQAEIEAAKPEKHLGAEI